MKSEFDKLCEYLAGTDDLSIRAEFNDSLRQADGPIRAIRTHVADVSRRWFAHLNKLVDSPSEQASTDSPSGAPPRPQVHTMRAGAEAGETADSSRYWHDFFVRLAFCRGIPAQTPGPSGQATQRRSIFEHLAEAVRRGRFAPDQDAFQLWQTMFLYTLSKDETAASAKAETLPTSKEAVRTPPPSYELADQLDAAAMQLLELLDADTTLRLVAERTLAGDTIDEVCLHANLLIPASVAIRLREVIRCWAAVLPAKRMEPTT